MSTQSTTAALTALQTRFSIVTKLMNTDQSLVMAGGGGIITITPDNPYYDRLKAILSDIGNDIASDLLITREQLEGRIAALDTFTSR